MLGNMLALSFSYMVIVDSNDVYVVDEDEFGVDWEWWFIEGSRLPVV